MAWKVDMWEDAVWAKGKRRDALLLVMGGR